MNKLIYIVFLLIGLNQYTLAQTRNLYVVTRKIEKEYDFSAKNKIRIKAEKGFIRFFPSKDNTVHIELRLILKNENQSLAKKELNYARYTFAESNKELLVSNSLVLPASYGENGFHSIFKAEYNVYVPKNITIEIINNFGLVSISNVTADISAILEYCDMKIENTFGKMYTNTIIGDLYFSHVESEINITSRYASVNLNDVSGQTTINAEYGTITAVFSDTPQNLAIETLAANVFIINKNCQEGNLNLQAKNGKLVFNSGCYIKNKKLCSQTSSHNAQGLIYQLGTSSVNTIKVETKFADINLD
jgi:hypothetical protein